MNQIDAGILRHRREFARALANHDFTPTAGGILIRDTFFGGVFDLVHRNCKGELLGHDVSPNVIPTEGLNHVLSVVLDAGSQVTQWYAALFAGDVTPGATLTAATFTSVTTEFTGYTGSNRINYVAGTASGGSIDNDASRAEFTINASGTLYGGALLSAQAKSATTGTLLAAARFSASRAVQSGDTLQLKYTLSATSN